MDDPFQPPDPICRYCEDWCSGTCEGACESMLGPEFKLPAAEECRHCYGTGFRMTHPAGVREPCFACAAPQNEGSNLNKPTEHHSGCAVYDVTRPELGECNCGFDPP